MLDIDSSKCNGCGKCADICPQQAIIISNNLASINSALCIQCEACLEICPADAIKEIVTAHTFSWKGGDTIMYGYGKGSGKGMSRGWGAGFGFRGASPSWPYYGRGRGSLHRCWYPDLAMGSLYEPAISFYPSRISREDQISRLKAQAEAIKKELGRIEARIKDLITIE